MTPLQSISTCLTKFVIFKGRATRSEYWWFVLFIFIFNLFIYLLLISTIGLENPITEKLSNAINVALNIPIWAVGSRRLHDIGKSGWWQLITLTGIGIILLIYWFCLNTKSAGDRFDESNKTDDVSE